MCSNESFFYNECRSSATINHALSIDNESPPLVGRKFDMKAHFFSTIDRFDFAFVALVQLSPLLSPLPVLPLT